MSVCYARHTHVIIGSTYLVVDDVSNGGRGQCKEYGDLHFDGLEECAGFFFFFRVSKECMEKGDVAMAARRVAVAHVGKHAKQPCGPNKAGWGARCWTLPI